MNVNKNQLILDIRPKSKLQTPRRDTSPASMIQTILPRRVHQILTLNARERLPQIPGIDHALIDGKYRSDELVVAEVVVVEGIVAETMVQEVRFVDGALVEGDDLLGVVGGEVGCCFLDLSFVSIEDVARREGRAVGVVGVGWIHGGDCRGRRWGCCNGRRCSSCWWRRGCGGCCCGGRSRRSFGDQGGWRM